MKKFKLFSEGTDEVLIPKPIQEMFNKATDIIRTAIENDPNEKTKVGVELDDELQTKMTPSQVEFSSKMRYFSEVIDSNEDFKSYAHYVMKMAHGDEYDQELTEKMANDLIEKYGTDFGAMKGAMTSGFGKNFSGKFNLKKYLTEALPDSTYKKLLKHKDFLGLVKVYNNLSKTNSGGDIYKLATSFNPSKTDSELYKALKKEKIDPTHKNGDELISIYHMLKIGGKLEEYESQKNFSNEESPSSISDIDKKISELESKLADEKDPESRAKIEEEIEEYNGYLKNFSTNTIKNFYDLDHEIDDTDYSDEVYNYLDSVGYNSDYDGRGDWLKRFFEGEGKSESEQSTILGKLISIANKYKTKNFSSDDIFKKLEKKKKDLADWDEYKERELAEKRWKSYGKGSPSESAISESMKSKKDSITKAIDKLTKELEKSKNFSEETKSGILKQLKDEGISFTVVNEAPTTLHLELKSSTPYEVSQLLPNLDVKYTDESKNAVSIDWSSTLTKKFSSSELDKDLSNLISKYNRSNDKDDNIIGDILSKVRYGIKNTGSLDSLLKEVRKISNRVEDKEFSINPHNRLVTLLEKFHNGDRKEASDEYIKFVKELKEAGMYKDSLKDMVDGFGNSILTKNFRGGR